MNSVQETLDSGLLGYRPIDTVLFLEIAMSIMENLVRFVITVQDNNQINQ